MRKFLITLLLLRPAVALAQPQTLAPGVQLTTETRVADLNFGAVTETFTAILPGPGGLIAFTNDSVGLVITPLAPDGTPEISRRKEIGGHAIVVESKGQPLILWSEQGTIWAARLDENLEERSPVAVYNAPWVSTAACDDNGCLVAFGSRVVATDTEGHAVGGATDLPGTSTVLSIVPDPTGFEVATLYGVRFPLWSEVLRVDRRGTLVYAVRLPAAPSANVGLAWTGDHDVLIASDLEGGIAAFDLQPDGTFTSRNLVAGAYLQSWMQSDEGYVLTTSGGETFAVDRAVTTLSRIASFDPPAGYALMTITHGIAVLYRDGSIYTMGSSPALLSYGPIPQIPQSVVESGGGTVASWTENRTLYAAHLTSDGVVRNREQVATRASGAGELAAVGSDVLTTWYDSDLKSSRAAVIHDDGSIVPVDLGARYLAWYTVATADAWIVVTAPVEGAATAAIRITRSGMAMPAKLFGHVQSAATGIDFDGTNLMMATTDELFVLTPDLEIVREISRTSGAMQLGFSGDSYLAFDNEGVKRLSPDGDLLSSAPTFGYFGGEIIGTSTGWLAVADSRHITQVVRANPPFASRTIDLADLYRIARRGADRYGMLTAHPVTDRRLTSPALFFRELVLTEIPRRHSVVTR